MLKHCICFALLLRFSIEPTVLAQANQPPRLPETSPKSQTCPQDLTALTHRLLQDLPSYINRARTRAGISKSYIMLAARPEFKPLPLSEIPALPSEPTNSTLQQIFFTTLMRRYERDRIVYLQEYHWVFLTQSRVGQHWQLAMMYSTLGPYPAQNRPPFPPRNSSEGSVAQAIRDWLNDCQSGSLPKPPKPS